MRRLRHLGIALLTAALLVQRPALSAEPVATARLLPSNTFVHFTIPSVDELKKRWDDSVLQELREDESLADFRKDLERQLDEASQALRGEIGLSLKEILAIPSGEFALAITQLPGQKFGFAAFLDFGESEDEVDQLLDQAARGLEKRGAERRVEEFEGTRIVLYTRGGDAEEGEPGAEPKEFGYFVKDTMIVVGNGVPVLQEVLSRWDGESDQTLAANEVYSYIVEQTETRDRPALLRWYVNPIDLMRAVVLTQAQGNPQAAMAFGFLPALGLDRFKAIGGGVDMATGEFESIGRTLLYVDQPAAGLLNVFQFPPADLSPPNWVPATVSAYYAWNWDVAGAYRAVAALVDTFQGPGAFEQMIESLASGEGRPGIHAKKDVIDQMTGRIYAHALPPRETVVEDEEVQVPIGNILVALGVKDAQQARNLITRVTERTGFTGRARQFQGETIYEFSPPAGLGDAENTWAFGVARDFFVLATNVTMLEQMLRENRDAATLAQSDEYKRVAEHLPAKTSMLSFQRQESQVKAVYEMLRSGQIGQDVEGIDFTKLPPFEQVQKYMPLGGGYTVPDKRGALFVNFSLRRDR